MKRVAVLGSTGSIGRSALDVVETHPQSLEVVGLAACRSAEALWKQACRHRPKALAMFEPEAWADLKSRRPTEGSWRPQLLKPGVEGLVELAVRPEADVVLLSVSGSVGFAPLLAALKAGKTVALANKEPMVMAGEQLMLEADRWQARLIPVDSEPSAVFQCLAGRGGKPGDIRRVILTASGGPFYRRKGSLANVSVKEALAHPNWKMGRKITVDSATLMNKGLEALEIRSLFGLSLSQIEIVIHPQSVIHSAVEFKDGTMLAQLSRPDMRLPIQYALLYPDRAPAPVEPLDLARLKRLDFDRPDFRRFPCLELALAAGRAGGVLPAVLSAADEVAVEAFLAGRLRFTDIAALVEKTMSAAEGLSPSRPTLGEIVEADAWARARATELLSNFK